MAILFPLLPEAGWWYVPTILTAGVCAVALARAVYVRRWDDQLEGIPMVQFEDGDNSVQRHIPNMRSLLHEGYQKACFATYH